ncbi:MAG: hypothetical protein MJ215_05550 [Spirochaetia bacterium]|nr:hypothetical protein [Spirochaetia bacterium]
MRMPVCPKAVYILSPYLTVMMLMTGACASVLPYAGKIENIDNIRINFSSFITASITVQKKNTMQE